MRQTCSALYVKVLCSWQLAGLRLDQISVRGLCLWTCSRRHADLKRPTDVQKFITKRAVAFKTEELFAVYMVMILTKDRAFWKLAFEWLSSTQHREWRLHQQMLSYCILKWIQCSWRYKSLEIFDSTSPGLATRQLDRFYPVHDISGTEKERGAPDKGCIFLPC